MKDKTDLIKASRVSAAAKKVGGVFVVATRNQQKLPQEENASARIAEIPLAEYSCKECATVFSANQGLAAHCVTCGSDHVECSPQKKGETAAKSPAMKHSDAELALYTCAGCGTDNILHEAVTAAAGHSVHCIACGAESKFETADALDSLGDPTGDSMDDLDLVDTSEDVDTAGDESLEDLSPVVEDPITDPADVTDADAEEMPPPPASNEPTVTLSPPVDPPLDAPAADPAVAPAVEYCEGEDNVDVNLLELEGDSPVEELSMVWLRNSLAIAKANMLLATLTEKDAGKNADIMQTQEFAQAVGHMIANEGLAKACTHYGFKPVIASIPMQKVVDKQVAAALAEKGKELADKLTTVHADFAQATDIAAAGMAKNFWQNVQDPLKAALRVELEAAGVKNPSKLLDKVWQTHAAASLRVTLEKARELSKKSVTARNELAETLDLVAFVPTKVTADADADADEDQEDDDGDEDDTVESRLATAAVAMDDRAIVAANGKPVNGRSAIRNILAGRQGHFNA